MKLITTLYEIRKHAPCRDGWEKLLVSLGKTRADDEPLSFRHILKSNGPEGFMWCLHVLPDEMDNAVRLLVCDVVEPAMRFVPECEARPQAALDAARAFARGEITERELDAARAAAMDAASGAAMDAASAAARDAAFDASIAAASYAARDAAWYAAWRATAATITKWIDEMEAGE